MGEYVTDYFCITFGTAQGAVTSPTLFSIYINDIPLDDKKQDSYSLLFADDLIKMKIFPKLSDEIENQINYYLMKIEIWLNTWILLMAPEKCFYTIFSQNLKGGDKGLKGVRKEKFNLYLYGTKLLCNNDPVFLGMRFDKYMSFNNQIAHIKKSCSDRLNIIKRLSHESWKINTKTLIQLYKSLIRSLIDYTFFIFSKISQANLNKLQAIQNNCLRIIYKKKTTFNINTLHELAELDILKVRAEEMKKKILNEAEKNNNPLIHDLLEEYPNYISSKKNLNNVTILDNYINIH